jgi:hypothetical protein
MSSTFAPLFAQAPGLTSTFASIFNPSGGTSPTSCSTDLSTVIKDAAQRMKYVAAYLDRDVSAVTISTEGQEDIYIQDHEANDFISTIDDLYPKAGDVIEDEAASCHR